MTATVLLALILVAIMVTGILIPSRWLSGR